MILFFFGEDTYRLNQKVKTLKEKYISASLGDTNLATIDGKTATYPEIARQILAFPFLAKSRLVIINNLIKEGKKEVHEPVIELLKKVPETTNLVFVEDGKPDKRTSIFKKLNLAKLAQEFKPLQDFEVKEWIEAQVLERGGKIDASAADMLYQYIGSDLWRLSNEIDKLYTYNPKITEQTVELLVHKQTQSDIFALVDAVGNKNTKKALFELHQLLNDGQAELYILTMLVYQYRNLLIVRDLMDRGTRNQWDIAKRAGLHPFVAGKTLDQAKFFDLEGLKVIYQTLLEQDLAIKTGQIEPKTALDLLVLELVR